MKYIFDRTAFAKDLHMARWERGWSMEELADRVGGSKAAVCRWENAKQDPPLLVFLIMVSILGLQTRSYIRKDLEGQMELPLGSDLEQEQNQEQLMLSFSDETEGSLEGGGGRWYRRYYDENGYVPGGY